MKNENRDQIVGRYIKKGWSVIPLAYQSKQPFGAWKEHVSRTMLHEEWYAKTGGRNANVGIVCGKVSRLIVVDVDKKNGGLESCKSLHLPVTYTVATGGGGFHYYYLWPYELPAPNVKSFHPGVDIQGDGSYVVAPPSTHPNGELYEAPVDTLELATAPRWLVDLVESEKLYKAVEEGNVVEGMRNASAASYVGKLFREHPKDKWESIVWERLQKANEQFNPPLQDKELRSVFESIASRAQDNESAPKASKVKRVFEFAKGRVHQFVKGPQQRTFVYFQCGDHKELHETESSKFRKWLLYEFYQEFGEHLGKEQVNQAIDLLASFAEREGISMDLDVRVNQFEDAFWYDLCDQDWRALKIDKSSWSIVEEAPPIFRRQSHQEPQVQPTRGGDIESIFDHIHITDTQQRLLFLVYLVSSFIPDIGHPIPVVYGPQGSAKSTTLRVLRKLIDPSALGLLTFPKSVEELVQQLDHHWAAFYDNVSHLNGNLSDELCRAVTGSGFSKRKLYTTAEDYIFTFRRAVALNGINVVPNRPDLLSRCLLFGLDRIDPDKRVDEKSFWETFEQDRATILGAVFTVLSNAIAIYPTIDQKLVSRMADFERWGYAISKVLGYSENEFIAAYEANVNGQNEEAIRTNDVAFALMNFMDERMPNTWTGTATELLAALEDKSTEWGINTSSKYWPSNASALGRRINTVASNLHSIGINIEWSRGIKRIITIADTRSDAIDGNDGNDTSVPF